MEMYLAGVSVRRVEDITEALWGSHVSPSTITDLNRKIFESVEEWRNRRLNQGILMFRGRDLAEMLMGRRSAERVCPCGHRREYKWFS